LQKDQEAIPPKTLDIFADVSSVNVSPESLAGLSITELEIIAARVRWLLTARPEQLTPPGDWRYWLILAGRGWGKTRTGAEDLAVYGLRHAGSRLAIVAPTYADARDTCVEGESGLLRLLPPRAVTTWNRSMGEMWLTNGSHIKLFSADQPERLRGPQFHRAWCDELAAFEQLQFALRLGTRPQMVMTTTPKPTVLIKELKERDGTDLILTRGRTDDNLAHLSSVVLEQLRERYDGTRLGRQELDGEILEDDESAFWSREIIEAGRITLVAQPIYTRVIIALDPAMSHGPDSDESGIIVAAEDDKKHYYILADGSGRYTPDGWAARIAGLAEQYKASMLIAEVNAGGAMIESVMRAHAPGLPVKEVRAARGKALRALPSLAFYEQGRVHHVGNHAVLEDQMCRFTGEGLQGASPDRVDALVWALSELGEPRSAPRIRNL
jgi:phage terminase large subunit-like protein